MIAPRPSSCRVGRRPLRAILSASPWREDVIIIEPFTPRTLLTLLASLSPLLLAASCLETRTPPFASAPGVLDGTWRGSIEVAADDPIEFRLENLEATQTGPASYRFQGDVRFGLEEELARIAGTGTVDPPFAPGRADGVATQMAPPPAEIYAFEAVVTRPDGTVAWRLEGTSEGGGSAQWGTAVDADGASHPLRVGPLGSGVHVMAFGTRPETLRQGEDFEVVWSGWAAEGVATRCRVFHTAVRGSHELEDCMSGPQRVTLHLPVLDPPPTDPVVDGVALDVWRNGTLDPTLSRRIDVPIHVADAP